MIHKITVDGRLGSHDAKYCYCWCGNFLACMRALMLTQTGYLVCKCRIVAFCTLAALLLCTVRAACGCAVRCGAVVRFQICVCARVRPTVELSYVWL